jgi:hypothetical protein
VTETPPEFPPPGERPSSTPPSTPPAPGWWKASDGNWYPPETAPGAGPPPDPPLAPTYGTPPGPPPAYGGAGYGYTPYTASSGTNGMAIASLVLGILWIDFIGSVLALIFGYIALGQIKKRNQGGRAFALAGIVLGWIGVALLAVAVVYAIASRS